MVSWSARCRGRVTARGSRAFEDQAAWLAVHCSKTAVAQLLRIAWRTVGGICERVAGEAQRDVDLLAGLRRIGIEEISHRKAQRYLTVVVDHDTGRLVWAAARRDRKTVERFLDELKQERCKQIELVSCDMASWIAGPIADRLPDAVRCVDPFHVVALATDALDRSAARSETRPAAPVTSPLAKDLKGARFALRKNPENLTGPQRGKLCEIQRTNRPLYRGYLLKEQLRQIYRLAPDAAIELIDSWIVWARRCRLPSFVKLAKTITAQRPGVTAAIKHGLSNVRVEAINTHVRLLTRRAFGFHSPGALIALAILSLADLCPPLPR
jgi:transposase